MPRLTSVNKIWGEASNQALFTEFRCNLDPFFQTPLLGKKFLPAHYRICEARANQSQNIENREEFLMIHIFIFNTVLLVSVVSPPIIRVVSVVYQTIGSQ